MDIVFAGTPDFAAGVLSAMIENELKPSLVLTQPDRKAGRGRKTQPSAVKNVAVTHEIDVYQPERFDDLAKNTLLSLPKPNLMVVIAYGLILPKWLLEWPEYGAINVHASLLPRWRGAAPIQRAIAAGDKESGVSIMQMDEGLDTGDVWTASRINIDEDMTAGDLHDQLLHLSQSALIDTIKQIQENKITPTPQPESGVTYAHKLSKAEAKINWRESAEVICSKIRAYNPVPVAHTQDLNGINYRIFTAYAIDSTSSHNAGKVVNESTEGIIVQAGTGQVVITELQQSGKKRLSARDFLNARSLIGETFN